MDNLSFGRHVTMASLSELCSTGLGISPGTRELTMHIAAKYSVFLFEFPQWGGGGLIGSQYTNVEPGFVV